MKEELKPSLNERWEVSGTEYSDFEEAIDLLTDCTSVTQFEPNEVILMSYSHEDDEAFYLDCHLRTGIKQKRLKKETLQEKNVPDVIIDEFRSGSRLMLLLDRKITAFTSPNLIGTLSARMNLSGTALFNPSLKRDAYMSELLYEKHMPINIVSRKIDDCTKVFAAHSDGYPYIPQTVLLDIADGLSGNKELGNPLCKSWNINHSISSLYIEFPEFADDVSKVYNLPDVMTPGVILMTSDVGDCSVSCIGTWKIKGSRIVQSVYKRRHRGNVSAKDVLAEIDREVFSVYRKLPERLAQLIMIDVPDPAAAIDYAVSNSGINEIGKKAAAELKACLISEINPAIDYTAYDIVSSVMSVPDRVQGLPAPAVQKLSTVVLKTAFLKWETFVNKKQKSTIVLTA